MVSVEEVGRFGLVLSVLPLVLRAAAGVHEEVSNRAEFESELLGDGNLHLLGGSLRFLKNGLQGAPLEAGKRGEDHYYRVTAASSRYQILNVEIDMLPAKFEIRHSVECLGSVYNA
ncbi:hypothetical protein AVEN_255103-1 [Araneus ventricosus]|uniref:Uncharacterized protein n=1 Tax=Araneus ventricosus TaxID=182803 RepID=A0A4Y2EDQ1_ARAVE|nr:hypothetical protein AVEN_255103-1 [Araneus ventricosus]